MIFLNCIQVVSRIGTQVFDGVLISDAELSGKATKDFVPWRPAFPCFFLDKTWVQSRNLQ